MNDKTIVGVFEKVSFPEFGVHNMQAKMDTGAYKGAFHCTKVHVEKEDGKKVLYFSPFDMPDKVIRASDFVKRRTTSSNGQSELRYVVDTVISLRGKKFPIKISLADRSNMRFQVLVGRRFMRHNNVVIDPTIKKEAKK